MKMSKQVELRDCLKCGGHCCESFYNQYVSGDGYEEFIPIPIEEREDTHILSLILQFKARGISLEQNEKGILRCPKHDPRSGLCTIYEKRPNFCRLWHCDLPKSTEKNILKPW